MYSDRLTDRNDLRGVQVAEAQGLVRFTSVFPACYGGRWPHLHVEVHPDQGSITDAAAVLATSQVALPGDACDLVYAEDGYESSVGTSRGPASTATASSATTGREPARHRDR